MTTSSTRRGIRQFTSLTPLQEWDAVFGPILREHQQFIQQLTEDLDNMQTDKRTPQKRQLAAWVLANIRGRPVPWAILVKVIQ